MSGRTQRDGPAAAVHGLLGLADRGGGLEGHAQQDGLAVADASLNSSGAVRARTGSAVRARYERIVVFAPEEQGAREAAADLEALRGRERHQGPGELRLELVEHGLSEAARDASRDAGDHTAQRIALLPHLVDAPDHLLGGVWIGAANQVRIHLREADGDGIDLRLDVVDRRDPRQHLDAGNLTQQLARDCTRSDSADGLSGAGATAALPVAHTVLGLGREVGVRGAVEVAHVLVRGRPGVLVSDQHCDRRAQGHPFEEPGQDFDLVGLLAGAGESALTGPPPVEVALDVLGGNRQAGRTPLHDHPDAAPVRLTEGGDFECLSERAAQRDAISSGVGGLRLSQPVPDSRVLR